MNAYMKRPSLNKKNKEMLKTFSKNSTKLHILIYFRNFPAFGQGKSMEQDHHKVGVFVLPFFVPIPQL